MHFFSYFAAITQLVYRELVSKCGLVYCEQYFCWVRLCGAPLLKQVCITTTCHVQ